MTRIISIYVTGYGLAIFVAMLAVLLVLGPVSAWGAKPKYLTVSVCAADPLEPGETLCQVGMRRAFPDRGLCQRAVDLDADGQPDQVWVDLTERLARPGQWAELQCPPYVIVP